MQRRSKRNRADESDEERVSKRQRNDGEILDHRRRASTAKERKSRLKRILVSHDRLNSFHIFMI